LFQNSLYGQVCRGASLNPPFDLLPLMCALGLSRQHSITYPRTQPSLNSKAADGWTCSKEVWLYCIATYICDYRQGLDWWMDLLITYTHNSELQAVTAPSLISTIHKAPHHPLSLFEPSVFASRSLVTFYDCGDSSASRPQVISSQTPVQNWTLNWLCLLLVTSQHGTHSPTV
jgi:hypothetical protein